MDPLSLEIRLGELEVHLLQDGHYRLDGGAMFGVVPRVLWERRLPPDELGRIRLGLNSLLVRGGGSLVLIEAGIGCHLGAKERALYAVEQPCPLPERLARLGVEPEAIEHVVLTHLNFDHIGHIVRAGPGGTLAPAFPRARHHVQRAELAFARECPARLRSSYPAAVLEPVAAAGLWELHEGDAEVAAGVRLCATGGHTPGHQVALVESSGCRLVFWGDLVPTSRHLDPGYAMAYDLFPLDLLAAKEGLVTRSVEEGWLHAFPHEPELRLLRARRGEKHFETEVVRTL